MSTPTTGPQTPAPVPPPSTSKITPGHSCVLCQRRKVRCHGPKPCSTCIKARVECVTVAGSNPLQRKAKLSTTPKEEDGLSRRRWPRPNDVATKSLESGRTDIEHNTEGEPQSSESNASSGKLIFEQGHRRFIEKYNYGCSLTLHGQVTDPFYSNLWTGISDEVKSFPSVHA